MRILLLADIHANWSALSAIREPFDVCLCLGDLVDYGVQSARCVQWVMDHAQHVVRGNHDHAVAQNVIVRGGSGFRELAAATRPLQLPQMQPPQRKFLSRLPLVKTVTLDNLRFFLVHATPRDPLDEYLPSDPARWKNTLEGVEADLVCVGHTHIPALLECGGIRVINPGSVGQPRDGDARASYVIIENGKIEFRRQEYDIEAEIRDMAERGVDERVVRLTDTILRTGGKFPADYEPALEPRFKSDIGS